ncbi:MAG: hypothetical protein U5K79_21315 [Cyclobacteriaceae bacterium]|nr:hypothetical protein [Cyclobacteriaceae bacterium]
MEYRGKYKVFNPALIRTYPISERENKVAIRDLLTPSEALGRKYHLSEGTEKALKLLAERAIEYKRRKLPVMLFTGAHLIKNGLGLLVKDLVEKDIITCVSGNMATSIHDFELALIGQTSEYVPEALEKGQFGMAYEFAFMNIAIEKGNEMKLGLGESLGKMILDKEFQKSVFARVWKPGSPDHFQFPELSVLAACYQKNTPFTIHAGIGTDVTDQHLSFNGEAKGGCSGRDFLIYTHEIEKLANGGMVINIGSAVTGPEVFLKAASMTGNIGKVPKGITTADFDLRPFDRSNMNDESSTGYYFRDQKSIVVRVPEAYGGEGHYVQGNQKETFPAFYQMLMKEL